MNTTMNTMIVAINEQRGGQITVASTARAMVDALKPVGIFGQSFFFRRSLVGVKDFDDLERILNENLWVPATKDTCGPERPEADKPPLGLRPRHIALEHYACARLREISEAIRRYSLAEKVIPQAWLDEMTELLHESP